MKANKLVVGVAGMPGSGKSLIVTAARSEGYAVIVMGDIVREETKAQGLELNPKNIGKVMLELRKNGGASAIAERCIPKMKRKRNRKIIVDGIRSLSEVETFKSHFSHFSLIAVHSSPETRFNRLYRRHRSDDPNGWKLFLERDIRELNVGLGNAISMAEHLIINESNRNAIKAKARRIFWRIERKWKS